MYTERTVQSISAVTKQIKTWTADSTNPHHAMKLALHMIINCHVQNQQEMQHY